MNMNKDNQNKNLLLSAPEEFYVDHINEALRNWESLAVRFRSPLKRTFLMSENEQNKLVETVIRFHDLGKLTFQWQKKIRMNEKKSVGHASLGAAYLFKSQEETVKHPMAFAILIHHTDRGIVTDGLENPDVRALNSGLISRDEKIRWDDEAYNLPEDLFPQAALELSLVDLKLMARELRRWSRSGAFIEMHSRRMKVSLLHHILRICDVRAASKRSEIIQYEFVRTLLWGGMIP